MVKILELWWDKSRNPSKKCDKYFSIYYSKNLKKRIAFCNNGAPKDPTSVNYSWNLYIFGLCMFYTNWNYKRRKY